MANEITKPSLPKKVYDKIEENVVDLYIELELTIPINPIDIAKRLGYELHYLSEIKNPNEQKIISDAITHTCEGVSYFDSKHNTYLIWINDINSNYQPRLNFTIMHEIGHIRLGHKCDSILAEIEANFFAAYALVPSPLPGLMRCESFIDIADTFHVSIECAYNSSSRIRNWCDYGGPIKQYEKRLLNYFKNNTEME